MGPGGPQIFPPPSNMGMEFTTHGKIRFSLSVYILNLLILYMELLSLFFLYRPICSSWQYASTWWI